MKNFNVTTRIVLFTKTALADGSYAVKLRVTFQQNKMFYSVKGGDGLPLKMSEEQFQKVMAPDARAKNREMGLYLGAVEASAKEIIQGMDEFSFPDFKKRYFGEKERFDDDILKDLQRREMTLKDEGRISTAKSFFCSRSSILSYHGKTRSLSYKSVNKEWLDKYERWMLSRGNSSTTIGIYLRNLRTLFNDMLREGKLQTTDYPFGKGKFDIPTGRNVKKALKIEQVRQIVLYKPKTPSEGLHRDLWLFSYFCNGANMKDLAHLKYTDIDTDAIRFIRAKTALRKRSDPKVIKVFLIDQLTEIIERWGNKPAWSTSFVFPILDEGLTPEQEYKRIQQVVKTTNKYINRIGIELGIGDNVRTYTARHTFASVLKHSGASREFISESLGHSDLKTTDNYLADFEIEVKKKWASKLI